MNVQARFKCTNIRHIPSSTVGETLAEVNFMAAYNWGKGNESWSKWTPSGEVKMMITNPAAIEAFEMGKEYLLTFTPAE